jgi:hypothetical protein
MCDININMITLTFHGHACSHALITNTTVTDYSNMIQLKLDNPELYTVEYAQHPFVNPAEDEFDSVVNDLNGLVPTKTSYELFQFDTQLEEWECIQGFDWSMQHYPGMIDVCNYTYKILYTRVADVVSWTDFKARLVELGCTEPWPSYTMAPVEWPILPSGLL